MSFISGEQGFGGFGICKDFVQTISRHTQYENYTKYISMLGERFSTGPVRYKGER